MEKKLDNVEAGNDTRVKTLSDFYYPFIKEVEKANEIMYKDDPIKTGEKCPICGADLIIKEGKNGQFVGCSNFPNCKYVKKEPKEVKLTGELCPQCGRPLVERKDKKGKVFIACSGFPDCRYIKVDASAAPTPEQQTDEICPKCGSPLVKKKGKYGYFLGCSNYPKCDYMQRIKKTKRN